MQDSSDPEGLRVFYYLVQDLKALVFSLISLHFKASMPQDMARCTAHNACRSSPSKLQSRNRTNSVEGYVGDRDSRPPAEYGVWNLLGDLGRSVPPCRPCAPMKRREYQNSGKLLERASRASWESRRAPQHTRALGQVERNPGSLCMVHSTVRRHVRALKQSAAVRMQSAVPAGQTQ